MDECVIIYKISLYCDAIDYLVHQQFLQLTSFIISCLGF